MIPHEEAEQRAEKAAAYDAQSRKAAQSGNGGKENAYDGGDA